MAKKKTVKKTVKPKTFLDKEKEAVQKAKKVLELDFKKAKAKLIKAEKDLKNFVHKNPKKAMQIAAGIGTAIAVGITAAVLKHKKK